MVASTRTQPVSFVRTLRYRLLATSTVTLLSDRAHVERTTLAPGLTVSRLVTGLWQVADMEREGRRIDLEAAARAMQAYVDTGCTTFDMADHYGSAEDIAGLFRRQLPAGVEVQLLTKWVPPPGEVTRQLVHDAVQRSLERLRVNAIDLLQFHSWSFADPRWLDCLFWLQELTDDGVIRALGVTNFDTAHLRVALHSGIRIASNQVSFSLLDRRAAGRMSQLCLESGVKLLAYGTVAGGFLSERWLGVAEPDWDELETWSQMKYGRFIRAAGGWDAFQQLLHAVRDVSHRHGVSMANVACRYALDQPAVAAIIVGARLGASEHIGDNRRIFGFQLDESDRTVLDAALSVLDPIPGDTGDEYRKPPYLTASGDLSDHLSTMPVPFERETRPDGRVICRTHSRWEALGGYSRAVRRGNRISVAGTTATHGDRLIGGSDVIAQTHFAIDKIEGALQTLGARLDDVVRTRIFVRDIGQWEQVARVHGERFGHVAPANTLVQAALVGDRYLVEIEADAELTPIDRADA
jgi:aryl-alcohol dehydrogenase-like predicted oxidoreductase/enamine deaminase RidA (YjgF/YER057c/UK114 family)